MRAYSLEVGVPAQAKPTKPAEPVTPAAPTPQKRRFGLAPLAAALAALLIVIAGGAWWFLNANRPASVATKAPAAEAARLSIVVLPFANLSGDPAQDYLVDALTDELTTSSRAHPRQLRHRAQHGLHLQGQAGRRQGDRQGPGRALCARRLGAAERRSGEGQRPAHRRRQRRSPLGRTIRHAPRRSVADAGRDRHPSGARNGASTHPRPRPPASNGRPRQIPTPRIWLSNAMRPLEGRIHRQGSGCGIPALRTGARHRSQQCPRPAAAWPSSSTCRSDRASAPTPRPTSSGPTNWLSQALALDPNYAGAHVFKGCVLLIQARYEEAIAERRARARPGPGRRGRHCRAWAGTTYSSGNLKRASNI